MAVFTDKEIVRAVFSNEEHDTIEVQYNHKDEGEEPEIISVHIPALDPDYSELKDLFDEGWDYERIQLETVTYNKEQGQAFRDIYRFFAQNEVKRIKHKFETKYKTLVEEEQLDRDVSNSVVNEVLDKNEDEDILFRAKLAVFEIPEIKALKTKAGRDKKQKIRTSETLLELFTILHKTLK